MTLEEQMQPTELDRLRVELEEAQALNTKLAGLLLHDFMADMADRDDRAAAQLFMHGSPQLYKVGRKIIAERVLHSPPAGEVLVLLEQVLTPDCHDIRKAWNKIQDILKKGFKP
jgi:hypothetical protein